MASAVLIVGCGDLGCAVAERLDQQDFHVSAVRYSQQQVPEGVRLIQADVTQANSLQALAASRPKILLYCVAANAQSDENYKAHYVDGLRNVLSVLAPLNTLQHVFFVSSTRVYGQQTDALLDEETPALASDFGGQRLLEAESVLAEFDIPATVFRLSGIYGPGRTRLIQLAKTPSHWPAHNSWTNRIHRDDGAAFIAECIVNVDRNTPIARLYLVTDSQPALQYEVLQWLAKEQGVDCSSVTEPSVTGGKRLSNQRMLNTGFTLQYPNYRVGYRQLIASS
jgi:nucleoside-diphosphate-sugar epimerase